MADDRRRAYVAGMGMYVPPKTMTNEDWVKLVDTSDEWITKMTGMKVRHWVEGDVASSDLAAEAAKVAMANAGVEPEEIDMILVATATPDMLFPSTACLTQAKIGAKNAFAYDISAGCSGFVYGMVVANQFVSQGTVKTALVIGAETLSRLTDMEDRSTCVLFGDGSGAAVIKATDPPRGIVDHYIGCDGKLGSVLKLPAGGTLMPASHETVDQRMHYIKMEGPKTYINAVKAMSDSAMKVIAQQGLTGDDVDLLFPHQANIRIIQSVAERAGMPMEKVFVNIHKYGNTSAASIPMAIYEAEQEGVLKEGMLICLVAFGAGFTWGSTLIRW